MGLFHLAYQAVMEPVGACLLETGQNAGRALRDAAAPPCGRLPPGRVTTKTLMLRSGASAPSSP